MQQLEYIMIADATAAIYSWSQHATIVEATIKVCNSYSAQSCTHPSAKSHTTVYNHIKQIDIYIARNPIIYIVSHKGLFVNIGICLLIYHSKSAPKAPVISAPKAAKEATQAHQGECFSQQSLRRETKRDLHIYSILLHFNAVIRTCESIVFFTNLNKNNINFIRICLTKSRIFT